jgi:hypothetical protein
VNLNQAGSDGTATLADGSLARFDATYADEEERASANVVKQANFNENLSILQNASSLMVTAHNNIEKSDTIQLKMWNMVKRNYQLQLKADHFDSLVTLHAWVEDQYLQTKQEVNLTGNITTVNFTVNSESGSWKSDRFRIVFQNEAIAVLPVTMTSVKATVQNGGVNVEWTVTNEVNIKKYTVERSVDGGRTYNSIISIPAKNLQNMAVTEYTGFDAQPKTGDNLYRIRTEAKEGTISYSSVVKVTIGEGKKDAEIIVYPNPVKEGKLQLQLYNLKEGTYEVSLYSAAGQSVYEKKITITQENSLQTEHLFLGNRLAQGNYQMRVSDSKGTVVKEINIMIAK